MATYCSEEYASAHESLCEELRSSTVEKEGFEERSSVAGAR